MRDYVQIQKEESAPSRLPEGYGSNAYGERAVKNVKAAAPFMYGKILNIGCGDGLETEAIIECGFDVVGLDLNDEKVEIAKQHGVNAVVGFMEELPFEDGEFSCVYCAHTLEHSRNIEKAVSEMERVSDRIIIVVPLEPKGTTNPAHTSVIKDEVYLKSLFQGRVIYERVFGTVENELFLVINNAKYKS